MSLPKSPVIDVVTPSRLDIFSKIDLAVCFNKGFSSRWAVELYSKYMQATTPDGKFRENDTKFSIDDYLTQYKELFHSLKNYGFNESRSKISVTANGIENGSHRAAAALVLGLDVATEIVDSTPQVYDWDYLHRIGLPKSLQYAMLLNFVQYVPKCRALLITSELETVSNNIIKTLKKDSTYVGSRKITLTPTGIRRLMAASYKHNDWWQDKYFETMILERYGNSQQKYSATLVLYSMGEDLDPRKIKEQFRKSLRDLQFDRQIHGTDTHEETLTLSRFFLNDNALQFHNIAPLGSENRILDLLRKSSVSSFDDFAVDGSAVLEIFGIREAKDVDYISLRHKINIKNLDFDFHNDFYEDSPLSVEDIILDPRNHFYVENMKFASLGTVIYTKVNDLDYKSKSDLQLLGDFLKSKPPLYSPKASASVSGFYSIELKISRAIESLLKILPTNMSKMIRLILSKLRIALHKLLNL